jgi:hypothetical protein
MKSTLNAFVMTAVLVGAISSFSSCKKDETEPTTTSSNSNNNNNNNNPGNTTKDSDKFVGTWSATDKWPGTETTYEQKITAVSETEVKLLWIAAMKDFSDIKATVSGTTITIPQQENKKAGDYQHINGSGTIDADGKKITIKYHLKNDNGNELDVTGTWTKI